MIKSIELPVAQIRMDKRFQPRFEIRQDRVDQFRESMRDGEEIPPIYVGEDDGEYVVIEGFHRLVAAQQENQKTIMAFIAHNLDKRYWLLDATRLNDKTSAPLSTEEVREAIRRVWKQGFFKNAKVIADRVGRNERFVQRALKPIRDQEKNERDRRIKELAEQGCTEEKIASEFNLSHQAINKIKAKNKTNTLQPNDTLSFSCKTDTSNNPPLLSTRSTMSQSANRCVPREDLAQKPSRPDFQISKNAPDKTLHQNDPVQTKPPLPNYVEGDDPKPYEDLPEIVQKSFRSGTEFFENLYEEITLGLYQGETASKLIDCLEIWQMRYLRVWEAIKRYKTG